VSDQGSEQAKNGRDGFDVYSADSPRHEAPKDGPVPGKNNTYEWTDDLSEGAANGNPIGTAHFEGTMQDDNHLSCSGTITLDAGGGWKGTVDLLGTLHLKGDKVGEGHLTVKDGQQAPFRTVHVTKDNPKRYKTV
jgi:hypothetical protein